MTVYDPAIYRTVVAENGGNNRKFHSINKLLIDMSAAGMIPLHVGDDPPGDTTSIWLDLTLPENGNGQAKVYDGGDWITLTPEYFVLHYGASTQAAEDAAAAAAASAAEASGYKDLTAADAVSTAADLAATTAAKDAAESAQAAAEQAQAEAEAAADNFDDVYLGSKSSDPTLDNDGNALVEGQLYWNSPSNVLKVYDGAAWNPYSAASGLTAVSDDTSPELGGDFGLGTFSLFSDATSSKAIYQASTFVPIFQWKSAGTPVNFLEFGNAASGSAPYIQAFGSNTDVAINLIPKGAGELQRNGQKVLDEADIGSLVQAYDAELASLAGASANGVSLVTAANYAAMRTLLNLVIGTNVQAYDSDLTTWAGVTPGTGVATALAIAVGSSGAIVVLNGALGTPSSGTLTNCTGLPASGVTNTALTVGGTAQGPITGGARVTPLVLNSGNPVTTGTVTVDPGDRPMQIYTNGGAHTLAEMSQDGYCLVHIANNASAGTVTTSGWDRIDGDSFTTTNGDRFLCTMIRMSGYGYLNVRAMQ